jgi:hypothetical protein
MTKLKLLVFLFVLGCTSTGIVRMNNTRVYPSGVVDRTEVSLKAPKYPLGDSGITLTTNGVTARLSGSQSASEIEGVKGNTKNIRLLFWLGGLAVIGGAVILGLPNAIFPNSVGVYTALAGGACIGLGIFAPALQRMAVPVISIVLLAVVGWVGYKAYNKERFSPKG